MTEYLIIFCCHVREKCPNTEVSLVSIFLYSVQIQENADQKKTLYLNTFYMQYASNKLHLKRLIYA